MGVFGHSLDLWLKSCSLLDHSPPQYTHTRSQDNPCLHLMVSLVMKISSIEAHYKVQD